MQGKEKEIAGGTLHTLACNGNGLERWIARFTIAPDAFFDALVISSLRQIISYLLALGLETRTRWHKGLLQGNSGE